MALEGNEVNGGVACTARTLRHSLVADFKNVFLELFLEFLRVYTTSKVVVQQTSPADSLTPWHNHQTVNP
jgi:hypothetical protein